MLTRPPFHLLATALVSRQFVPMTRIRIEGLLAAFPKLVGTGKQHTYVETENVRYVYQPLDQGTMYLLLVTNETPNILRIWTSCGCCPRCSPSTRSSRWTRMVSLGTRSISSSRSTR